MFGKKKGYRVDAGKNTYDRRFVDDHYYISTGKKKGEMIRHGELLTEGEVRKLGIDRETKKQFLVPVTFKEKETRKQERGCGSRTTRESGWGNKPTIRGSYQPNRGNAKEYTSKKRKELRTNESQKRKNTRSRG